MATGNLYVEYGFRCVYCGFDGRPQEAWWLFTDDHIVPKALGGSEDPVNVVLACSGCNSTKRVFDPTEEGRDPLTPESRERLIGKARSYIVEQRAKWAEVFRQQVVEKLSGQLGQGPAP